METQHQMQLLSLPLFPSTNPQPAPVANSNPHISDLVCVDLRYRKQEGIKKYGTPLQANNGRDALQDAYEEALDLAQYIKQTIVERDNERKAKVG